MKNKLAFNSPVVVIVHSAISTLSISTLWTRYEQDFVSRVKTQYKNNSQLKPITLAITS